MTNNVVVMVTRSGDSGKKLTQNIKQQGISCYQLPTLKIVAEDILLSAEDYHQAIFVSPNAVKYSVNKSQTLKSMLPTELIAVGPGTADSLYQAGYKQVVIPQNFNSEGLLELPQLQDVKGQQILIIKGRGGRAYLGEKLTERGAICHYLEVYCRVTTKLNKEALKAFLGFSKTKIITMASVDSMQALAINLGEDFNYQQLGLVVASERIKRAAMDYGYQQIVVADSASNDAMLKAIKELVVTN